MWLLWCGFMILKHQNGMVLPGGRWQSKVKQNMSRKTNLQDAQILTQRLETLSLIHFYSLTQGRTSVCMILIVKEVFLLCTHMHLDMHLSSASQVKWSDKSLPFSSKLFFMSEVAVSDLPTCSPYSRYISPYLTSKSSTLASEMWSSIPLAVLMIGLLQLTMKC